MQSASVLSNMHIRVVLIASGALMKLQSRQMMECAQVDIHMSTQHQAEQKDQFAHHRTTHHTSENVTVLDRHRESTNKDKTQKIRHHTLVSRSAGSYLSIPDDCLIHSCRMLAAHHSVQKPICSINRKDNQHCFIQYYRSNVMADNTADC